MKTLKQKDYAGLSILLTLVFAVSSFIFLEILKIELLGMITLIGTLLLFIIHMMLHFGK